MRSFRFKLGVLLAILVGTSAVSQVVYRSSLTSIHGSLDFAVGALETLHATESFHLAIHSLLTTASRRAESPSTADVTDYEAARKNADKSLEHLATVGRRTDDPYRHPNLQLDPRLVEDSRGLYEDPVKETDAADPERGGMPAAHIERARALFDGISGNQLNAFLSFNQGLVETLQSGARAMADRVDVVLYVQLAFLTVAAAISILFSDRVLLQGYRAAEKGAYTDGLTGLKNRRYLDGPAMAEMTAMLRARDPFSLLLADVDHFKLFNDTYGHQAGDAVLREVAGQLRRCLRKTDRIIRYGGEEFLVVLLGADKASAVATADKIRERLSVTGIDLPSGKCGQVTASFGVASYPEEGIGDCPALIKKADERLYEAKAEGEETELSDNSPRDRCRGYPSRRS